MSEPFAYDAVEYPSSALPQMHPGHLAAVARMFGCRPAPVDACRYLEFGCGDGTHLIACAMGLPDATFVGVDLSAEAVARGRRLTAELGVTNVELHAADVTAWTPPAGGFDFACAHGLYSWVPPAVREAVMAGISTALAPHGIGYVSYNTYPGCHLRRMVWDALRQHTAATADPRQKIREATDLLKLLLAGLPADGREPPVEALAHEIDTLLRERTPGGMFHDDLGAVNDPVYFREFADHAGRHGLRFVAESGHVGMQTGAYPAAVAGVLNGMAERDVLAREQFTDHLRVRRFRQTLLAKDGRPPLAHPDPAAATALAASGALRVEGEIGDPRSAAVVAFRRDQTVVRTSHPLTKAVLLTLAEGGPKPVPFAALLAAAVGRLGRSAPTPDDGEQLCGILTEAWAGGMVKLHGHVPRYADAVSERPTACPFARACGRRGGVVTTRLFNSLSMDDPPSRRLLELLDGTRTTNELAAALRDCYPPADRPPTAALRVTLRAHLERLARNGLLVG
jgi:SAM-dependent methyltransferase